MQLSKSMINDNYITQKSVHLSHQSLHQIPLGSINLSTVRSRSQDGRPEHDCLHGTYKTEIIQTCGGNYIKRFLPHGEYGARWDSTLRLAPSMGTLSSHQWSTLSCPTATQESMRQLAQRQNECSSKSQMIIENAVKNTFDRWFRPSLSRDASITYLKSQPRGGFIIRRSCWYPGFYGLSIQTKDNEGTEIGESLISDLSIRHFLIGESTDGYFQIQGTEVEPRFKNLTDLVIYHCQHSGALPCVFCLPGYSTSSTLSLVHAPTQLSPPKNNESDSMEFQVLYLGTFDVFSLNGTNAIISATDALFRMPSSSLSPLVASLRASPGGVTLTDLYCRQFLRRHFGCESFLFIGTDPYNRTLIENHTANASTNGRKIFGFVVRVSDTSDMNSCHLFAQQFNTQPCEFIVEIVKKLLCQERPFGF